MVQKKVVVLAVGLASSACMFAANWAGVAGNPQRDGWAQGDKILTPKAFADKTVKLLYKHRFAGNKSMGLNALGTPIDLANIIGYTGFHEVLLMSGSSNAAYALDADLNLPYFENKFDLLDKAAAPASTVACPGGVTSSLIMSGNSGAPRIGGGGGFGGGGGGGFGRPSFYWTVSSDGYLRTLRQQDGQSQMIPPQKFLPPNSNTTALNTAANIVYVSTINGCSGPNALYAAQFTAPQLANMPGQPLLTQPAWVFSSFQTNGTGFSGTGGTAISNANDKVFGQIAEGHGDVAGEYNDTVVALDPKTLAVKDYFTPTGKMPALPKSSATAPGVTPLVFNADGKDMLIAGARDGRIYLLDSTALGGSDHHRPVFRTEPVANPDANFGGDGIFGTFATWVDPANGNTRWLFASVHGASTGKFGMTNGAASGGSVVAFKVEKVNGSMALTPQWISANMDAPSAPITANGLVYVLSTGMPSRTAKADGSAYTVAEVEKMSKPAVMYVLDGTTGKQVFASAPASSFSNSGLGLATGRVYFTTHDSTVYAYGVPQEM